MAQEEKRMAVRAAELEERRQTWAQEYELQKAERNLRKERHNMERKERKEKNKSDSLRDELMRSSLQSFLSQQQTAFFPKPVLENQGGFLTFFTVILPHWLINSFFLVAFYFLTKEAHQNTSPEMEEDIMKPVMSG